MLVAAEDIGSRIKSLRREAKLTQVELGAEIGISRSHLSKIEKGDDLPGRETLAAIATRFNVSLDWLASGVGDPRSAEAANEKEALLLFAYRQLPTDEAELHLNLMLKRVKQPN